MSDVKSTGGGPTSQHSQLSTVSHMSATHMFSGSLVPRPSYRPVFGWLQYAKTEGDDLVCFMT